MKLERSPPRFLDVDIIAKPMESDMGFEARCAVIGTNPC